MKPSVCRIVLYRLTEIDAAATNKRRQDAGEQIGQMRRTRPGFQAHIGEIVHSGEQYPMMVTRVHHDGFYINGKVFLDGNDSFWAVQVAEGTDPGQWSWPPRD